MAYFSKAVHVELANEGWEIIVFEKPWQDSFSEVADVFDVERVAGTGPWDDVVDGVVLSKGMGT